MEPINPATVVNGVLPDGNAAIRCSSCSQLYDKGCPPQSGQSDASFVCEPCQSTVNRRAIADAAPTIDLG